MNHKPPKSSELPTILVTGGAGFIGSCLVRQLVAEQSSHVVTLDKLTYAGSLDRLASVMDDPCHTFERCDILDRTAVSRILSDYQPVQVFHLAAESHVDRSIDGPGEFIQTNVVGTFELLEAVRAYWDNLREQDQVRFRFLHVSTDEVYGSLGASGRFREDSPYAPNSPYSASKAAADHLVRAYHATYGLPIIVTNCSNNYGPFQFPEKLIPLMILNAREGKALPVYGNGSNVRDWLYVDDHCRALRRAMLHGKLGETYNIGGDCEHTNLEIVKLLCQAVDELCPDLPQRPCEELISYVTDRPGHDQRYAIDASKIRNELGWRPLQDFSSGIRKTVEWYLSGEDVREHQSLGQYARGRLGLTSERRN